MAQFESRVCGRCTGKGFGSWVVQNGVCFRCNGKGNVLTAAGKAQRAAFIAERMVTVTVAQLAPGDVVAYEDGKRVRRDVVEAIRPTEYAAALRARRPDAPTHFITYVGGGESYVRATDTVTVWVAA